jgi:subtilase family serine protease
MIMIGAGALLISALTAPSALAVAPAASGPDLGSLRGAVHNGTLSQTHGVHSVCAGADGGCQAQLVTTAKTSSAPLVTDAPVGYGPPDLAAAYQLPAASVGTAGTIAVIDAGAYPNLEQDLGTYRSQFGLAACTIAAGCLKVANYVGGPPLSPASTAPDKQMEEQLGFETTLDIDMASAACPGCHLIEIQVPLADGSAASQTDADTAAKDFASAVGTAIGMGATAVSISYQFNSDDFMTTGDPAKALNHKGVAIVASSGDNAAEGKYSGWPQNLGTVTSVGGTSLYTTNPAGTQFTQTAWSNTGSGCALNLPPANGQPATIATYCQGHRASTDISSVADPSTGVATYDTYSPASGVPADWTIAGGTSAGAPFIAGLYARGANLAGVLGPNTLYSAPSSDFSDVTLGQNSPPAFCQNEQEAQALCKAGAGWDGPTGIGTPAGLGAF